MTEKEPQKPTAKLKRKKKSMLIYHILLFLCVFCVCVILFLSGIKSLTPVADVEIGNEESITIDEDDLDFEIKSVDERLKWIQMEDDLPTVAVRKTKADKDEKKISSEKNIKATKKEEETKKEKTTISIDKKEKEKVKEEAPKPNIKEIEKEKTAEIIQKPKEIIPLPIKQKITFTKVYLGNFSSLEEAILIQKKVNNDFPNTTPFIKASNNHYIVQIGSFTDKEKAESFIIQLRKKGYNPKTL